MSTVTPSPAATTEAGPPLALPWWVPGDTNAFFGLGFNVLVNVLVLTGLVVGVVGVSQHEAFHTILPALGVELLIGNVYYTYLARRLARRENRTDVAAMPYGPSVPHMFIVTFVIFAFLILLPGDPAFTILGEGATAAQIAEVREKLQLDRPIVVQYVAWLQDVLTGDFGRSIRTREP